MKTFLQEDVWATYRERRRARAAAFFTFTCVECGVIFRGSTAQAKARGWKKVWRTPRRGVREQHDRCPSCKGVPYVNH